MYGFQNRLNKRLPFKTRGSQFCSPTIKVYDGKTKKQPDFGIKT